MNRLFLHIFFAIFSIIIFLGVFSFDTVFANTAWAIQTTTTDFTSSGFVIELDSLDPIGNGQASDSSLRGKAALLKILEKVSEFLLMLMPLIAGVALIISGYFFIFSGGESEKVTLGKNIIKFNIIALVVAFFSWGIISIIASFFNS